MRLIRQLTQNLETARQKEIAEPLEQCCVASCVRGKIVGKHVFAQQKLHCVGVAGMGP